MPSALHSAPRDPDVGPRIQRRHEVLEHFVRGEGLHFDLTDGLERIRCPVLVLAGELDPVVTVDDARDLVKALPASNTRFEQFADAGHLLVFEQPAAVMRVVTEFLSNEAPNALERDMP